MVHTQHSLLCINNRLTGWNEALCMNLPLQLYSSIRQRHASPGNVSRHSSYRCSGAVLLHISFYELLSKEHTL